MGNAMSALSREEREAIRDGRLSGPGDHLVEVSHDDLAAVIAFVEGCDEMGPQSVDWETLLAVKRLTEAN